MRVAAALRQASAAASETSTEDQASDHSAQSSAVRRPEFKLEITEDPPTADQLQTILNYVDKHRIGSIVKGAADEKEALRKLKESADNFQRPVVCPSSLFWLPLRFSLLQLWLTGCCSGCRLEQWKGGVG